jgi:hypothetical protein
MRPEERIIQLFSILSGIDDTEQIKRILLDSEVYNEVVNGNEVYLYEGSVSNIIDIAEEFREKGIYLDEIKNITTDNIKIVNRTITSCSKSNLIA